jgi:HlyD family secretion protein
MNPNPFSIPVVDAVPDLQNFLQQQLYSFLQQQLRQAGRRNHNRKAFQLHFEVDWDRLLISIDLSTPIKLDPQRIVWLLEKLLREFLIESVSSDIDHHSALFPTSFVITLSLWEPGRQHTYICHSFTIASEEVVSNCAPETAITETAITEAGCLSLNDSGEAKALTPDHVGLNDSSERKTFNVSDCISEDFLSLDPEKHSLPTASVLDAPKATERSKGAGRVKPIAALALIVAGISGGLSYYAFAQEKTAHPSVSAPAPASTSVSTPALAVSALGRIEPNGGIIKVSVANAQDSRVNQLMVNEGDRVEAGQVIAILQGADKKQAALVEAQHNVEIARAKLIQARSGTAKTGEISAQTSNIGRLEAQLRTATTEKQAEIDQIQVKLRNAERDYLRHQQLSDRGAISHSVLEKKQEAVDMAQAELEQVEAQLQNVTETLDKQIQQERSLLSNLSEVRPVDVNVFQAQLEYALTQVDQAKAELDDLSVRAPVAGQILKINTRVGEQVSMGEGIVELGQTEKMYAIAEVYETDVSQIQAGHRATIVSENGGFVGEIQGIVEQIGLQIKKKNILDSDPAAEKDARVVEVKILLEPNDIGKVARLSNLQVRVRIDVNEKNRERSLNEGRGRRVY